MPESKHSFSWDVFPYQDRSTCCLVPFGGLVVSFCALVWSFDWSEWKSGKNSYLLVTAEITTPIRPLETSVEKRRLLICRDKWPSSFVRPALTACHRSTLLYCSTLSYLQWKHCSKIISEHVFWHFRQFFRRCKLAAAAASGAFCSNLPQADGRQQDWCQCSITRRTKLN